MPVLPAHRFQSGDTVSLRPSKLPGGVSVNANASNEPSAGIVYRVEEDSITVAFTTLEEDLDGEVVHSRQMLILMFRNIHSSAARQRYHIQAIADCYGEAAEVQLGR